MNKQQLVRTIGHRILEGPTAIFPPSNGYDWLEKDVSIYTYYYSEGQIQQISLWTDDTMNKESNFLKPIIRFAHWERNNDIQKDKEIQFPDVRVLLGYIKEDLFSELNRTIIDIQNSLPSLSFKPLGISLQRDVAEVETGDSYIGYELFLRNGAQSITYNSPFLDKDSFSQKVVDLKSLLMKSIDVIDLNGWKEKYDASFDAESFMWDYKTITY